jgi:hypothetical protein
MTSVPGVQPFVPLPPVNLSCDEAFTAFHDNLPSNRPANEAILTAVDIPGTKRFAVSTIELYGGSERPPTLPVFCFVDALLVPRRLSLSFDALYHRRETSSESSAVTRRIPAVPVTDVRLLGRIYLKGGNLEHQHEFYQHNFTLDPRTHDVILVSHIRGGYQSFAALSASVVVRGRVLQSSDS